MKTSAQSVQQFRETYWETKYLFDFYFLIILPDWAEIVKILVNKWAKLTRGGTFETKTIEFELHFSANTNNIIS